MSHPSEDTLADIAAGGRVPDAEAHVVACDDCAATLASLRDVADLLSHPDEPGAWDQPSPGVWSRVRQEAGLAAADEGTDVDGPPAEVVPLGLRRRRLMSVAAAAACIVVGLVMGRWVLPSGSDSPTPVVTASTSLATLDGGRTLGSAELAAVDDGSPQLTVRTRPFQHGSGYVEVWLINTDGERMVSLGVLDDSDRGTFTVPQTLLEHGYRVVDISREGFDDSPAHSGDSVMRGTLPS